MTANLCVGTEKNGSSPCATFEAGAGAASSPVVTGSAAGATGVSEDPQFTQVRARSEIPWPQPGQETIGIAVGMRSGQFSIDACTHVAKPVRDLASAREPR